MSDAQNTDFNLSEPLPVRIDPVSEPQSSEAGFKALVIISRAGRTADGRALVLCRCDCGTEFMARRDYAKNGRVKRCPECRHAPAALIIDSESASAPPQTAPAPEQAESARTPKVIQDELADNAAALKTMESDIVLLSRLLAKEGVQPAGIDGDSTAKRFRETITTANYARKERKRLEKELRDLSGQKAVTLNSSESVLARARLRGGK